MSSMISDSSFGFDSIMTLIDTYSTIVIAVSILPALLNCFFGFIIQKITITLNGILTGGIIGLVLGAIIGIFSQNMDMLLPIVLVLTILMAALGGFLAFKLFMVGVFFENWGLASLVFVILMICAGLPPQSYPLSLLLGLFAGILSVIVYKAFIIISKSVAGGLAAGLGIGRIIGVWTDYDKVATIAMGIGIGIVFAILGMLVQFKMNKKRDAVQAVQTAGGKASSSSPSGAVYMSAPMSGMNTNAASNRTMDNAAFANALSANASAPSQNAATVYTASHVTYNPKAMLTVSGLALVKFADGSIGCNASVDYFGDTTIVAVKGKLLGYDISGEFLGEYPVNILDLHLGRGMSAKSPTVMLSDPNVRRVQFIITQTVDEQMNVTSYEDGDMLEAGAAQTVESAVDEATRELLGLAGEERYIYEAFEGGFYHCTCGKVAAGTCPVCGRTAENNFRTEDIPGRIETGVKALLAEAGNAQSTEELEQYRDRLQHTSELLSKIDNTELFIACETALQETGAKLQQISDLTKARNHKARKLLIIIAACAIGSIGMLAGTLAVLGAEPSEKRVKRDATRQLLDAYGSSYEINFTEFEKHGSRKNDTIIYDLEVEGVWKNYEKLNADLKLQYDKGKVSFRFSTCEMSGRCTPLHTDFHEDVFMMPDTVYLSDENGYVVCENAKIAAIDYDGIRVNDRIAEVPVHFSGDYKGLARADETAACMVTYRYISSGKWETGQTPNVPVAEDPGFVAPTKELLEGLVANDIYEIDNAYLPMKYMSFDVPMSHYSELKTLDMVTAYMDWDNGEFSMSGTCSFELSRTPSSWDMISFTPEVKKPLQRYKIDEDMLRKKVAQIINEQCAQHTNVTGLTLGDITMEPGILLVDVTYQSAKDIFVLTNKVRIRFADSLNGIEFKSIDYETYTAGLPETLNTTCIVNYSLVDSGTVPTGMSKTGTAVLSLDISRDMKAILSGTIGNIPVFFGGTIDDNGVLTMKSDGQRTINVNYKLLFNMNSDLAFEPKPSLTYKGGKIEGSILFDSVAIGVKDFSIYLN